MYLSTAIEVGEYAVRRVRLKYMIRIRKKKFKRARRIKNIKILGDYAKNNLLYMENTPIDIKIEPNLDEFSTKTTQISGPISSSKT